MPLGWLHTWTLPRQYKSQRLRTKLGGLRSLQTISITVKSPFRSDYMVYWHLMKSFLFILATNVIKTHPNHGQKTHMIKNNHSNNLNGSICMVFG
jgi:hypothetical protein